MANYTNTIPANPRPGDVITFTGSRTFVFPGNTVANVEVAGAAGGKGGNGTLLGASVNSPGDYVIPVRTGYGGEPGKGAVAKFQRSFTGNATISITIGTIGADGKNNSSSGGATGGQGSPGGTTTLNVDGENALVCYGGGGGKGGSSGGAGGSAANGAAGTNGTGSPGASATNTGAGYVKFTLVSVNDPPISPNSIDYGTPFSGRPLRLTCTPSTDPEGGTVKYIWETHVDTEPYMAVAVTDEPHCDIIVPTHGVTFQARVKAADSQGAESGYATGVPKTIIYNYPPIVKDENGNERDADLGEFEDAFEYKFAVNDPDVQDTLSAIVKIDGLLIQSIDPAVRDQLYAVEWGDTWLYLPNGKHTLTITAKDNNGAETVRTISFERQCRELYVELREPIPTESRTGSVYVSMNYSAPEDFEKHIWICNNAYDPEPAWEEVTEYNKAKVYTFQNSTLESPNWGVSVRVRIIKLEGRRDEIVFSGGSLILDANDESLPTWAVNVAIDASRFSGALNNAHYNVQRAIEGLCDAVSAQPLKYQGKYSTYAALLAERPTGEPGEAYWVGTEPPYDVYAWSKSAEAWINLGTMQGTTDWAGIRNRPSAAATEIDASVDKAHSHANFDALSKITSSDGRLVFDNAPIGQRAVISGVQPERMSEGDIWFQPIGG